MGFIIGLLTFVLVVDCLALCLLVLVQLPKKEAGLGLAFGGGAADALFGAGSGTVLTKATKYAAGIFFALAIVLGIMQSHHFRASKSEFQRLLEKQSKGAGLQLPPLASPETPATTGATAPSATPPVKPAVPPAGVTRPSPAAGTPTPGTPAPANPTPPK